MRCRPALFGLTFLASTFPALAQQPLPVPDSLAAGEVPPDRVGRVSYVSGSLAFHMQGETVWSAAGLNYPVSTGGSFWTDPKGRAEQRIGPNTLHIDGGTEIDLTTLNDQVTQIGLPTGRAGVTLRQLGDGESFEIDIPLGGIWLLQSGHYDVSVGAGEQPTRISVFDGSAHFTGSGADVTINAGQVAILSGANPASIAIEEARPDAFVTWWREREYDPRKLAASTYVSPYMTGYEELDSAGRWDRSADYGQVWYPTSVPASWAPYRDGHWTWVEPWGWNWVDDQPWGFAPFHYGRWAEINGRWGWVPGTFTPRPVYAPALVAFIGSVTIAAAIETRGPNVGWFPLAPNEPYWPGYTRNVNYIRRVNVTNVTNINNITINNVTNAAPGSAQAAIQRNAPPPAQFADLAVANRRFATVVPQQTLTRAAPVAAAALTVPAAALQAAPIVARPSRVAGGEIPAQGTPPAIRPALAPSAATAPAPTTAPGIAGQPGLGQAIAGQAVPGQAIPGRPGSGQVASPPGPSVAGPGVAGRGTASQNIGGQVRHNGEAEPRPSPGQTGSAAMSPLPHPGGPVVPIPGQAATAHPPGQLPGTMLNPAAGQSSATLARPNQGGPANAARTSPSASGISSAALAPPRERPAEIQATPGSSPRERPGISRPGQPSAPGTPSIQSRIEPRPPGGDQTGAGPRQAFGSAFPSVSAVAQQQSARPAEPIGHDPRPHGEGVNRPARATTPASLQTAPTPIREPRPEQAAAVIPPRPPTLAAMPVPHPVPAPQPAAAPAPAQPPQHAHPASAPAARPASTAQQAAHASGSPQQHQHQAGRGDGKNEKRE